MSKGLQGFIILVVLVFGTPIGVYLTVPNSWFLAISIFVNNGLLCMTFTKLVDLLEVANKTLSLYYKDKDHTIQ